LPDLKNRGSLFSSKNHNYLVTIVNGKKARQLPLPLLDDDRYGMMGNRK
jgi:hypothetical protein